ncbi:S53 family peptidase [Monashia sp. NPDC004114]
MSRLIRSAAAFAGVAAIAAATVGAASAAPATKTLPGSVPSWANAAHRTGSSNSSTTVTFRVYLDYSDPAAAAAYANAVSTKGSSLFGHFLTPAQFRAKFSPSQTSVDSVSSWLRSQGFTVGAVPANRKYVEATGSVAQTAAAFKTTFSQYSVQGHNVRANSSALTIPASLGRVEGVLGLDESQTLAEPALKLPAPAGFRNAQPCSSYWGEKTTANTPQTGVPASPNYGYAPCGYSGAQLQGVYGVDKVIAGGNSGEGVTVGIIDAYASPTIESDVNTYSTRHHLPTLKPGQFTQVVAPGTYNRATNNKQDPTGWAGEETLDIEAVHTMAPGANITYIGAPNNYRDLDAIMNKVVDGHLADIVSNSYGYGGEALPTGYIKPQLDTQIQAAAEGISLFFSSGDNGDETGGNPAAAAAATPDWPASSPFVTAVGGTSIGVGQDNSRVFELGWQSGTSTLKNGSFPSASYLYGAGGGTSRIFTQPDWQKGVVPDALALGQTSGGRSQKMRVVPDVSAIADPNTGMLVGETQQFSDGVYYDEYRIGGTSLASPIYAGIFALVVKAAGHDYGLANPALYAARSSAYDVTKNDLATYPGTVRVNYVNSENDKNGLAYVLRTFDQDQNLTIHVANGYDDITGVGSPNGSAWFNAVVGYTG